MLHIPTTSSNSPVSVGPCALGKGLFATLPIGRAETILQFTGPEISRQQALAKGRYSFNVLQVGPGNYMDLEEPGVILNHCCEPNAGIVDDTVLIALRDIQPGEEITFDYSTTMSEKLETMRCLCGAPTCRKVIGDFHDLPDALKERYLAARLVQDFIVREHRARTHRSRPRRSLPLIAQGTHKFLLGGAPALLDRQCA